MEAYLLGTQTKIEDKINKLSIAIKIPVVPFKKNIEEMDVF